MNTTLPTTRAGWYRRVWSVAWPIMLSNVSVPLVGIVDTAVVGLALLGHEELIGIYKHFVAKQG